MIKVNIKGQQQAQAAIRKALAEFASDNFVTVGIHEDTGMHPDSGVTNAQLGAIQHFGTDDIPARPWLDVGVATGHQEYANIIAGTVEDGGTLNEALNKVGVVAVGKAQQYIIELKAPPNAKSTIKAKGSANPLIDTGAMMQSVNFKIESGMPNEEGV